ncbi:MAG: hypothetical protein QXS59_08950 [Metallosphaera sp.]
MTAIFFDSPMDDASRRRALYHGNLFVFSPRPSAVALAAFAREMLAEAFRPYDPRAAQHHLPVEAYAAILARLKPAFIHHPRSKELVRGTPSSRVSNLSLLLNRKVSREEALNALLSGFLSVFEAEKGELTPLEIELSKQLSYKYTNDKWTFVR